MWSFLRSFFSFKSYPNPSRFIAKLFVSLEYRNLNDSRISMKHFSSQHNLMIACTAQVSLSILNQCSPTRVEQILEITKRMKFKYKIFMVWIRWSFNLWLNLHIFFLLELMNHHNLISLMSLVDAGLLFHPSSLCDIVKLVEIILSLTLLLLFARLSPRFRRTLH